MAEPREQARQKALAGIKAAGEAGDWRALKAFLRMSFPADYRRDASVNVNAIATAQQAGIVIGEEAKNEVCVLDDTNIGPAGTGGAVRKIISAEIVP